MNVSKKRSVNLILLGSVLAFGLSGCKDAGESVPQVAAGGGGQAAPQVQVVTVALTEPEWEQTYPGRVESVSRVVIRPRVSGLLEERLYEEGKPVAADEALFRIDPEPFEVAAQRARAEVERANAGLRQAEREWERVKRLFDNEALSERQRDDALAAYELAQATAMAAKAALRQAELEHSYTTVRSPISGVTDRETVPAGSLVTPQDELTVVTQIDPIYVSFSLPVSDPAYHQLSLAAGSEESEGVRLQLYLRDGSSYKKRGSVNYTASGIDPQTGTVEVRAVFPNPEGELLPGEFARVAFSGLELPTAAVIPEKSVLSTAQGNIVYTIGEGNTIAPRPVTLGPLLEEGQMVLTGLKDGDKVVTTSLIRIRPGMTVTPVPVKDSSKANQESVQ